MHTLVGAKAKSAFAVLWIVVCCGFVVGYGDDNTNKSSLVHLWRTLPQLRAVFDPHSIRHEATTALLVVVSMTQCISCALVVLVFRSS